MQIATSHGLSGHYVWEVTLLEIFFTFDLVRVPGFGMAPQTTFDLFCSCFSKCEAMEQCTCMILNNFVGVALQ